MKVARIYIRVSTDDQNLERQRQLAEQAKAQGYYVADIYEDVGTGTKHDRDDLQRLIKDLQPGDVVVAEKIDRITRAPLPEAEALVRAIKDKGATLSIPGMLDLSDIEATGMTKIVLDAMQEMLLKIALQMARDDYETRRERQAQGIAKARAKGAYKGRPRDETKRDKIRRALERGAGVRATARDFEVSPTTVVRVKKEMEASQ